MVGRISRPPGRRIRRPGPSPTPAIGDRVENPCPCGTAASHRNGSGGCACGLSTLQLRDAVVATRATEGDGRPDKPAARPAHPATGPHPRRQPLVISPGTPCPCGTAARRHGSVASQRFRWMRLRLIHPTTAGCRRNCSSRCVRGLSTLRLRRPGAAVTHASARARTAVRSIRLPGYRVVSARPRSTRRSRRTP